MRTLIFVLALILAVPGSGPAQDAQRPDTESASARYGAHRLYFEIAGNSLFGATVNYEIGVTSWLGLRVGHGQCMYTQTKVTPVTLALLAGTGSSKFELAGGVVVASENMSGDWRWDGSKAFPSVFFGYRYQPPRGFLFRIGVSPVFWTNSKVPWFGLSLGIVA